MRSDLDGRKLGSLIGGAFGLAYVEVNAGSLPTGVAVVLRIAAGVAFLALIAILFRSRDEATPRGGGPSASEFGTGYWLVVAAEVVAIFVGARVITGPLGLPSHAVVAWVSVVVGVHFVALAFVWDRPYFRVLGYAIVACGAAGIAAAALGASAAVVATIGGVLPGALLLAAAYWGALGLGPDLA
jgi:hypothetical protein